MMKINVSEIAEQIGHEKAFSFDAKPEDIGPLLDDCKLEGPIMVKGTATNTGTCFRLEGKIFCTISEICDRCLEYFQTKSEYSFAEEYTRDEEFAKIKEINHFDGDIINIPLEDTVSQNSVIELNRVSSSTVTETETVEFETEKVNTDQLYVGQTKVKTSGQNGKIEYTYAVTYVDGVETERQLVGQETVKETVNKVVLVGTKKKPTVVTSSTPTSYKAVYTMTATAYTYGNDGGNMTATGIRPYRGIVALDPRVIPLGTKLYIETSDGSYIYGTAVAADTGGAIKGNKIDVFLETNSECISFGRRTVNVYVLD